MDNIIEVGSKHSEGAKINLTIDLAPADCYVMCKQLFEKLNKDEKIEIIKAYYDAQKKLEQ